MIKHSVHNCSFARNPGRCKLFEAANAYLQSRVYVKAGHVTTARDKRGPQANIYLTIRSERIRSRNGHTAISLNSALSPI